MNFDFFGSEKKKAAKKKQREREEIIIRLPGFINQLLLLMDSGLIISDAFKKTASEYGDLPEEQRNYFTDSVYRIYEESLKSGENVINSFYAFAGLSDSKELIRTGKEKDLLKLLDIHHDYTHMSDREKEIRAAFPAYFENE